MSKQIKLKSLLKEGYAWERKPGKPLPTIQEVMDEFQASQTPEVPPVPVQEVEDMSSKFWVVAKNKRGELYVFNDGYYNTKEEAEEALKNITVPKIVDANTIKVEPVPTSPNYTVLYDNLSEIQKIFHKKSKKIKLMIDSDHTLLYRLNDDIKSIKKNLEKEFENFNSIIEETRKELSDNVESVKDEIYSIMTNDTKKELFNLQLVIEDGRKELLNQIDSVDTKVEEVYSELDSLK